VCIKLDSALTRKVVAELSSGGRKEAVFYKVFKVEDGRRLLPLFQNYADYASESGGDGWMRASEKAKEFRDEGYSGAGTYHAYMSAEEAEGVRAWIEDVYPNVVVREVTVPLESIVGCCGISGAVAFKRMRVRFLQGEGL